MWPLWWNRQSAERHTPTSVEACFTYCARCPVRRECLEDAFDDELEIVGVFGGSTTLERRQARNLVGHGRALGGRWRQRSPEEHAIVIDLMMDTFEERFTRWRQLADEHRAKLAAAAAQREAARESAARTTVASYAGRAPTT